MATKDKLVTLEDLNELKKYNDSEVGELKSDLNYVLTAPAGYVLRATDNGHGNEWAMVGTPTDAQAETAINKWLDEHPEATTTVQDGSLTLPKFKDGELPFVTPEQFGAKGNGVVDDSTAFATAFASYKCVHLIPNKKYLVTQKINISSNTIFNGNGSTIICGGDTPVNIVGDEVVVENICFEGTQAQTQYAINIDTGAENTTIRNVYGTGLKYSLVMNDGTGSVIENCYANLCGWDCVSNYSHAKNSIISNCFAIKTGRHGFSTDEGANGITFENCYAEDIGSIVGEGHSSFHLEGASYCTIRNCKAVYTANHPKKDNMGNDIYTGFRIDSASSSMVGNVIDGLEIIYENGFSTEAVSDVKPLYLNSAISNNTIKIHNLTIKNYTGQVYTIYIGVMLAYLYNFIVYGNCPMLQYSSVGGLAEIKHGTVNMLDKTNIFYRAQYIANGLVVSDVYAKGCSTLIRGRLVNCILENNVIEDCNTSFVLSQATGDSSAKSHGNIIRNNTFKDLLIGVQLGWWTGTEQNIVCKNVFTGTITTLLDGNYCGCYFYDNIQKDLTYTTAKTNVTVTTTPPTLTV